MDGSDHLRTVSALLDLDEFEVVDLQQDRRGKQNVIGVIPKATAGLCPHCRGVCDERHQTRESRVMDLPMGGCRTELKVARRQFHGRACDKFFTPRSAALARLSEHREALRRIFDDPAIRTPDEGRSRLMAWCERGRPLGLAALEKFNGTLERWMNEIANYFASRSSHGRTEGFNHGIRSILWRAYGMTAFGHFRLRVLHTFG